MKASVLGSTEQEKLRRILHLYGVSAELGLDHFVLDSERSSDDLSVRSLADLVRRADEVDGPRVVITLPVRRSDFSERLRDVMRLLSRSDRASICLVAGNPAYLTEEERRRSAGELLASATELVVRELGPDAEVFVGTEKVEKTVEALCQRLDVIPFFLLDRRSPELLLRFRSNGNRLAVYVPFAVGQRRDDVMPLLFPYVERRMRALKLSGSPSDHVDRFCVIGTPHDVSRRLRTVAAQYDIMIGYPAVPDSEQLRFWSIRGIRSAKGL